MAASNTDITAFVPSRRSVRAVAVLAEDKKQVRFLLETKPKWKYPFLSVNTQSCIIDNWRVPGDGEFSGVPKTWGVEKKKVYHLIRQVYGQMISDKLRHGVFHIYEIWWFCSLQSDGTMRISNGFNRDATNPSVLHGLRTLEHMEHKFKRAIQQHPASPNTKPEPMKREKRGRDNDGGGKCLPKAARTTSSKAAAKNASQATKSRSKNASRNCPSSSGLRLATSDIELSSCQHLATNQFTKVFSTECGLGFVKIVIDSIMGDQVQAMENEARIYSHLLREGVGSEVPTYYGFSSHLGVPLLCTGMEGPDFEDIGLTNLPPPSKLLRFKLYRRSATLECIMAIWPSEILCVVKRMKTELR